MINHETLQYHRRVIFVASAFVLLWLAVIARLFGRSVLQNGLADAEALSQQQIQVSLNPNRGTIYLNGSDGTKIPVAMNDPLDSVNIIPNQVVDPKLTASKLAPIIGVNENDLFNEIDNKKPYLPPVKTQLPLTAGQQVTNLNLPGVSISQQFYRTYPEGPMASQVLGFVNAEGQGQYGIEGYYNNQLQGFEGSITGQRDGWGNVFLNPSTATNNQGASLTLTLDRDVQVTVEQMLQAAVTKFKAKSGSVVIVDPKTGAVIAMANDPTFDPNNYSQVPDQSVFQNNAISRAFEPGSVLKSVSISAGLDSGKIPVNFTGTYGNSVSVGNAVIHTATFQAFGHETLGDVLANSDNVAMVDISSRIGRDLLFDYLERFNFDSLTGIDLDTEASGSMPMMRDWLPINLANISFGQGIAVTSLQMTMAYAAIANKGVYMQPYVMDSISYPDGKTVVTQPKEVRQVVSPTVAQEVTQMLLQVVNSGEGRQAGVAGYAVAGKTGTAQIADPVNGGYLKNAENGSFAGFAPADDPKFAMFVTLDRPQGVAFAESSAAPLWGQIAKYLLETRYHIQPTQK